MITKKKEITAKDIKRLQLRVYKRYTGGEISDGQAQRETTLLNNTLKAIETTETEERLARLEELLR